MGLAAFERMRREQAAKKAEVKETPSIDVGTMKRHEVVECLVAHGVDKADTKGVNVDILRENLKSIMFVG